MISMTPTTATQISCRTQTKGNWKHVNYRFDTGSIPEIGEFHTPNDVTKFEEITEILVNDQAGPTNSFDEQKK